MIIMKSLKMNQLLLFDEEYKNVVTFDSIKIKMYEFAF